MIAELLAQTAELFKHPLSWLALIGLLALGSRSFNWLHHTISWSIQLGGALIVVVLTSYHAFVASAFGIWDVGMIAGALFVGGRMVYITLHRPA